MRIGVDFDDVLIDMNGALMRFHNETFGTNYSIRELQTFDLEKIWNCTRLEMTERMRLFYRTHDPRAVTPIQGAVEILNRLKADHSLFIITGRPHSVEEKTRATMAHHYPGIFKEVHFTNFFAERTAAKTKAQFCRELGIELFIDDHHGWSHQIAEAGIDALLFDAPWNQEPITHEKVKRIRHWDEVHAFVQGKAKNEN